MPKSSCSPVHLFGVAILCTGVVGATLALSGSGWMSPKSNQPITSLHSISQAQPQGPRQFFQVWVHRNEIMPDLIYARPGRALLRAENETSSDIELLVERLNQNQANTPQASIQTVNKAKRASQEIILQPGEYVYFSAALPQLKGRLVVRAH